MRVPRALSRRSFLARVAGASVFGSVAIVTKANAQNATGITDSDRGPRADRAGYGRGGGGTRSTGLTDRDQGASADRAGYGRGAGGRGVTGMTDADRGAYADAAGNGRGVIGRDRTPAQPVIQRVTARDVETVRRAFAALAGGDPNVALGALDPRVRWQAVAGRETSNRVSLDRRGADVYVRQMARSIARGERRLEIISIAADGDRVVVESAWVTPQERGENCLTAIQVLSAAIVAVDERPAPGFR